MRQFEFGAKSYNNRIICSRRALSRLRTQNYQNKTDLKKTCQNDEVSNKISLKLNPPLQINAG